MKIATASIDVKYKTICAFDLFLVFASVVVLTVIRIRNMLYVRTACREINSCENRFTSYKKILKTIIDQDLAGDMLVYRLDAKNTYLSVYLDPRVPNRKL